MSSKTQRIRRSGSSRPAPLFVMAIVAVVAAGLLAVVIAVAGGDSSSATPTDFDTTAAVTEGAALAELPEAGTDPAVGQQAPLIEGTDRNGDAITLPSTGKPTIVLFLAHWCPHCQREVPALQQWIDEGLLPEDVEIVAVATGIDPAKPNYPPSEWLDGEEWTPPTVADATGAAAQAYGLSSFPFWVAVDADGTVVDRQSGELTLDQVTAMAARAAA
jgi:thiol-disulfide isomerase/thioredoxin